MKLYRLENRRPVLCRDSIEWAEAFNKTEDRRVGLTRAGAFHVSTVFLGIDHNYFSDGPPILFETMIFADDDASGINSDRYSTWEEAEAGHARAVKWAEMQTARLNGELTIALRTRE